MSPAVEDGFLTTDHQGSPLGYSTNVLLQSQNPMWDTTRHLEFFYFQRGFHLKNLSVTFYNSKTSWLFIYSSDMLSFSS